MSAGIEQTDQKISLDLKPNVLAFARANDLDLTPEGIGILEATLASLVRIDGNAVSFVVGDGKTGTIDEALTLYSEGMPRTTKSPERTRTAPAGSATARALAQNAARRSPAREASAADLVNEHGNPWHPRSINRTRQSLVTNLHPQLAATLKAQAGA